MVHQVEVAGRGTPGGARDAHRRRGARGRGGWNYDSRINNNPY